MAPEAGSPMTQRESVTVITNKGIKDDRYASGVGAYSKSNPKKVRDISLITREGIDAANDGLHADGLKKYLDSETRRNVVIDDMSADALNHLLGKEFYLGTVRLKATELCIPCERPAKLSNNIHFLMAFENKGGIRAQVLEGGDIRVGDPLNTALLTELD
jgi:MOSC domain-containing protein YiiM